MHFHAQDNTKNGKKGSPKRVFWCKARVCRPVMLAQLEGKVPAQHRCHVASKFVHDLCLAEQPISNAHLCEEWEPSLTGQIVLVQGKSLQACHNSPAGGQRACTAPTLWSWHFEWVFRSAWLPSNHASEVCRIAALTGQIGLVQSESLQTHHLRPARG